MPRKKASKRKKITLFIGIILLVCFILFGSMILIFPKKIYQIESRTENIKEERKKDEEGYKTFAWLRVQGTKIDTPIIGYERNDVETKVSKKDFLWNIITKEKLYNKVNIMGHNIMNLSKNPEIGLDYFERFEELMAFIYPDFVKENKYIQYTIDGKDYLYKIFAVGFEERYDLKLYKDNNYTKKELKSYIKKAKKNSLFEFDIDVDENDKIITLITCTRMFGKENSSIEFKVDARMVRKNERLHNYQVEETDNYKEIEKIMKGDEVGNEKA